MKQKVKHRIISNIDKVKVFENKNKSTNSLNDTFYTCNNRSPHVLQTCRFHIIVVKL